MRLCADFDGILNRVIPLVDDEVHMSDALNDALGSFHQACEAGLDPRVSQAAHLVERAAKLRDGIGARRDILLCAVEDLSDSMSGIDETLTGLYETARRMSV